jgi:hypothetical protein
MPWTSARSGRAGLERYYRSFLTGTTGFDRYYRIFQRYYRLKQISHLLLVSVLWFSPPGLVHLSPTLSTASVVHRFEATCSQEEEPPRLLPSKWDWRRRCPLSSRHQASTSSSSRNQEEDHHGTRQAHGSTVQEPILSNSRCQSLYGWEECPLVPQPILVPQESREDL